MSKIMSLEGPRLTFVERTQGHLLGTMPRSWSRAFSGMTPVTSQVQTVLAQQSRAPKIIIGILGTIFGGWLAGTPSGQNLVRRVWGK